MAPAKAVHSTTSLVGSASWAVLPSPSSSPSASRRPSAGSYGTSTGSNSSESGRSSTSSISDASPRVQLVPHAHRLSHDASLSQSEKEILDRTNFDAGDLSSKDFDFEDIFTYGRPQKQSKSTVEAPPASMGKDWADFSFSHYSSAKDIRHKAQRNRNSISEMYVKNKSVTRRK